MPFRYILSSVWVRLSIFSHLSIVQYMGLGVSSLPISLVMIERTYTLSYHHHQLGNINYYPLFRVRSWNNGVRCVSLSILMVINKTIGKGISLFKRSCPYEFNASIYFWLKTTSQVDVSCSAPSIVFNNSDSTKPLPSPNLYHTLMLCCVTRSECTWERETLRRAMSVSKAI